MEIDAGFNMLVKDKKDGNGNSEDKYKSTIIRGNDIINKYH